MPDSPNPTPFDLRRPLWLLPVATFVFILWLALALYGMLRGPTTAIILPEQAGFQGAGGVKFAAAAAVWAAAAFATTLAATVVLAVGVGTVIEAHRAMPGRRARAMGSLLIVGLLATLVGGLVVEFREPYLPHLAGAEARLPLGPSWVAPVLNALAVTAIASLFAGLGSLIEWIRSAGDASAVVTFAGRRLRLCLTVGSAGTVAAVFNYAALHRLAGAAIGGAPGAHAATVTAIDGFASAQALFWGVIFSGGLMVLLGVGVYAIHRAAGGRAGVGIEAERIGRPALAVLAACAPLIAGGLSEVLVKLVGG